MFNVLINDQKKLNLFGSEFRLYQEEGIDFFIPSENLTSQELEEIDIYKDEIIKTVYQLSLLEPRVGVDGFIKIAFFQPEIYWQRFTKKAEREGFDSEPWTWSEGDTDFVSEVGDVFCIKLGAEFKVPSERNRFLAHELNHLIINKYAPVIASISGDIEGMVEADARIGLEIQKRFDMEESTKFICSLTESDLYSAEIINIAGYTLEGFQGKRPSESTGYTSCFLWFLGMALRIGHGDYKQGRKAIMSLGMNSLDKNGYINGLSNLGFDYIEESKKLDVLLEAQRFFQNWSKDLY